MGSLIDVERILEPYKILRNTDTLCVATIRQNILECPTVEAIPKADYEKRLKADLITMLVALQLQFASHGCKDMCDCWWLIEDKINALKAKEGEK
jgi:hypothetical protein